MKKLRHIFSLLMCVLITPRVFASQVTVSKLEEIGQIMLDFFTSRPVQILFAIALAAMAVGFVMNRDNQDAKKKFLKWGIGIGLVLSASGITDIFFTEGLLIP